MTTALRSFAFLCCGLGCGVLGSAQEAEPRNRQEQVEAELAGSQVSTPGEEEALEMVAPLRNGACRKVGDKVQLDVALADPTLTEVTWLFRSDAPDCPWITVASQELGVFTAGTSLTWDTSCVQDYANGCGFGTGVLRVEASSAEGHSKSGSVNFCLQSAARIASRAAP